MLIETPDGHQIDAQLWDLIKGNWTTVPQLDWDSFDANTVATFRREAEDARKDKRRAGPNIARIQDMLADGYKRQTPVRLYDPAPENNAAPCVIYFHGGGWFGGDIESRDDGTRLLAHLSGAKVISVDYARAPEAKFPVPLYDCIAVTKWVVQSADTLGVNPAKLFVAGDSAGANLALSTAISLRDDSYHDVAGMLLFYGVYAHDHNTDSHRTFGADERFTLSSAAMDFCWQMYLANPADDQNPLAAPLLAPLHDLPPAHIMCGSLDPLLDDTKQLQDALTAQNNPDCALTIYPGVTHSFLSMISQLDCATQAWEDAASFIRTRL